jgi:hypothetical protein
MGVGATHDEHEQRFYLSIEFFDRGHRKIPFEEGLESDQIVMSRRESGEQDPVCCGSTTEGRTTMKAKTAKKPAKKTAKKAAKKKK